MTDRARWTMRGLVALATAVVFVIDLQTPWGVATWILYALPMFLLCYASGVRYLVPFAALVSALIVLDHFLSGAQAPLLFSLFNRTAGLVVLWGAVWLLVQRERKSLALRHLAESLEAKVAERTESLQAANIALRQAEEHCRQGEAHLRALLEHCSDMILEYDENIHVRYVSPSAKRLLGYEPERMVGKPGLELVHPEDAAAAAAAVQRVLDNPGSVERLEHRLRHRNGTWLWFEAVGSECLGDSGLRGVVVNSRDITERKSAEQALRESEERFRLLFELSPVGIGIADEERRLTAVNKAAADMFGYRAEEMIGMAAIELTHPEDRERELALVRRLRAGEIPWLSMEVRYLKKDGRTFWGELTATTVRDSAGRFVCAVGMVQDVTDRKESEQRRIEALERQRDALLGEVHHRIKNNLQGVVGLLEQHARASPELAEAMRAAIARVNSVATVHGLHAAGDGGSVRLCNIVDAIGEYQRTLFPEVELRIERPGDWREMRLDEREAVAVALVVNELALNAIKVCLRERCEVPVTIAFARDAEAVRVTVSNAVGRLPEGFDFAAARGLGTGLTLVKSLLPPQGTRLTIRQREPQGVEAELRLMRPVIIGT